MRRFLREYGYLTLMVCCLACSSVLLWSVSTGRPLATSAPAHVPVLRVSAAEEPAPVPEDTRAQSTALPAEGYLLTEEELESRLADFLPDTFPACRPEADLEEGRLQLSFAMEKQALKDYLSLQGVQMGLQHSLLLGLLPKTLELKARFLPAADAEGVHLRPLSLELGDKDFPLQGLPEDLLSAVDQGINALLKSRGVQFTDLAVTEDGILLK